MKGQESRGSDDDDEESGEDEDNDDGDYDYEVLESSSDDVDEELNIDGFDGEDSEEEDAEDYVFMYWDEENKKYVPDDPANVDLEFLDNVDCGIEYNEGTRKQMICSRNCHKLPKEGRRLYTEEDWQRLFQIYKDQGGKTVNIHISTEVPDGFVPPARPGQTTNGKGRGLFAARDIKRGEMTYGPKRPFRYAYWRNGTSYRTFIDALSDEEACDVMMWTWTETIGGWKDWKIENIILLHLDHNSFQNNGGDKANTGCPQERKTRDGACGYFHEYALRDIKEGEELLCDYRQFYRDYWSEFGL